MSDHAQFSPSGLYRVAACPGSPNLIAQLPEELRSSPDTAASLQGTLRHLMLAERFKAHVYPGLSGEQIVFPSVPTADDWRALDVVWPYVENHKALSGHYGCRAWSEQKLEIGRWCGLPQELLWGTADLVLATPQVMEIADAKFGRRLVEPDSIQLKAYAVGAGALLMGPGSQFTAEFRQLRTVRLTILQPEAPRPVSSQDFPLETLQNWAKEIGDVVRAAQAPEAPLNPGDHCTFCPAGSSCPARNQAAQVAVSSMFEIIGAGGTDPEEDAPDSSSTPQAPAASTANPLLDQVDELAHTRPEELNADQLGRILDLAPVVEALFKALRTRAEKLLRDGQPVDGWKLIEGRRGREWTIQEQADLVAQLRKLGLSAEEIWDKSVRTPAALDKIVGSKANKRAVARFAEMWTWKTGKPVLAPESSPEPAWRDANAMFETQSKEEDKQPEPEPTKTETEPEPLIPDWL